MRALVYHGPGQKAWEEVAKPTLLSDTDAIVQVDAVTICGTDLHILKGDVPAVTDGRILGHEAVGTVQLVGSAVRNLSAGERVLVSCLSACGHCRFCHRARFGQASAANGFSATPSRAPGPKSSRSPSPTPRPSPSRPAGPTGSSSRWPTSWPPATPWAGLDEAVSPGDVVAVVGAGPIGLSAITGTQLFSPSHIMAIDLVDTRLETAKHFRGRRDRGQQPRGPSDHRA